MQQMYINPGYLPTRYYTDGWSIKRKQVNCPRCHGSGLIQRWWLLKSKCDTCRGFGYITITLASGGNYAS